jgi:MscS family membrane protein
MKKTILLLLLTALLFAATGFWEQVTDIEKQFYTIDSNATASTKDSNTSLVRQEADSTVDIDAKFNAFNTLISTLKAMPYDVQDPQNSFFRPSNADARLFKLSSRIRINREHGYTMAVNRDKITIQTIKLKQQIYVFFATLAVEWTDMENNALNEQIAEELRSINTIPLADYTKRYSTPAHSDIEKAIRNNLDELRMHYYFYKDFLHYLKLNPNVLHYRSLLQQLQLGSIISAINKNSAVAKINTVLRYVKLDLGRLSLFLMVFFMAWIVALFVYFKVYNKLRALITHKVDYLDDMMLSNIENIRRPLFILILSFGLELGLEILHYPNPTEKGSIFFYFIYLVTISYTIVILIDNFVFHFLLKRTETTSREMRSELINLILSIIKIVIFVVAGLLFLVRIGINITGLIASLGIGGLAVALAAKDTLSNFFGLLKILSDNSFSQGDWIQADNVEGTVVEIGFISTDIRTFDNALITVPNEKLANTALKNWNRRNVGRRIKMHIGVTYGSDRQKLAEAIDAIRIMLQEHPDIVSPEKYDRDTFHNRYKKKKKLFSLEDKYGIKTTLMVYLDQLSASSMDILVYAFSNTVNWQEWLEIKQDIIFKIWEILEAHDLEFAFPSQSLYFDKENIESSIASIVKESSE